MCVDCDPFFLELCFFLFDAKITESVSLEKHRKRLPPFILKTRFAAKSRKLHHRLFVFSFKQTITQPASSVVVLVVVVLGLEARLLFIYQATTNERKKFSSCV